MWQSSEKCPAGIILQKASAEKGERQTIKATASIAASMNREQKQERETAKKNIMKKSEETLGVIARSFLFYRERV